MVLGGCPPDLAWALESPCTTLSLLSYLQNGTQTLARQMMGAGQGHFIPWNKSKMSQVSSVALGEINQQVSPEGHAGQLSSICQPGAG